VLHNFILKSDDVECMSDIIIETFVQLLFVMF
jgi:hypothetical protein